MAYTKDNYQPCRRVQKGNEHTSIEVIFTKLLGKLHKVTLDKGNLILQTGLLGVVPCTTELEFVVVEADNLNVGKAGDFASGSTNTTANIENAHARAQTHLGGEVVLVAGQRSKEGLSLVEPGEVEGLRPTPLIQVRRTVIVA